MKRKYIFRFFISLYIVLFFLLILLSIIGYNDRLGYVSDLNLDYHNTFIYNGISDENILTNTLDVKNIFLSTNKTITNYIYNFRINYYTKVFRHSDIFGVYLDTNSLLSSGSSVLEVNMNENGSPFGSIISSIAITDDKIDNIIYKLKIRKTFILYIFISFFIFILIFYIKYIYLFFNFILKKLYYFIFFKRYSNCRKYFIYFLIIIIIMIFIISYLGKIKRIGYLSDFRLDNNLTLQLNNITNINVLTNSLDFKSSFIETNAAISMYSYIFRINYYTKIFRHNDIFDVYINSNNIISSNDFILELNMNESGSPFGTLVSDRVIKENKVDSVIYYLMIKLKIKVILILLIIFTLLFSVYYMLSENIITINKINIDIDLYKITILILRTFIILSIISLLLLLTMKVLFINKSYAGELYNISLNIEDTLYYNNELVDIYYDRYHSIKNLHNIYYTWNNIDTNIFKDSFIYTNNKITNYVYNFSLLDDSFLYKLNFLYDINFNIKDILSSHNYISDIKQYSKGDSFGTFYSTKNLKEINNIDNIIYSISIKESVILCNIIITFVLLLFYILLLCYDFILSVVKKIKINFINKLLIIFIFVLLFSLLLLNIISIKDKTGYITDFNLMIKDTIKANNIEENLDNIWVSSNIFTTNKLLTYSLQKEFIFTNKLITNYYYYYNLISKNKLFNDNIFYYIDNIKVLDNLSIKLRYNTNNFGYLISTNKLSSNDVINNILYNVKVKSVFHNLVYFIIFITIIFMIIFNYSSILKYIINIDSYTYIKIIIIFSSVIALFEFWLLFPGYFAHYDEDWMMAKAVSLDYDNWYPVAIQVFLTTMYQLFGYKTFYIFLLNLICWYTGITLVTVALFKKYKDKRFIFLIFVSCLPDIFFNSFLQLKDISATLLIWLLYSTLFYTSIVKVNKRYTIIVNIIVCILVILSIVWRHNFIVTVYPMCILFTYRILKHYNNKKNYFIYFIIIMFLFAISFIFINKGNTYLWIKNNEQIEFSKDSTTHLFLLQIIGTASRANDGSLIPEDWYYKGKTFEDLKLLYFNASTSGDVYRHPPGSPIKFYKLRDLKKIWILYILKHPISYLEHVINFTSYAFFVTPWLYNEDDIQRKTTHFIGEGLFDNNGITFSELRYHIYSFLFKHFSRMYINIFFYIILSFILFIINIYLLVNNKNKITDIQVFSIVTSISSLVTIIIVSLFAPAIIFRYFFPIIPINILSLISLLVFYKNKKNIT